MNTAETVAAIDVGSTAVKGVVLSRDGTLLADHEVPLETVRSAPGWAEQDAQSWWIACEELVAAWKVSGVDLRTLRALSVSGQMQDVVLTRQGEACGPALLYSDSRAGHEERLVTAALGLDVAAATGNPAGAASVLPKLLWLRRHRPDVLAGGPRLHAGAKDYLIERLCGAHVCDHTTAATTGLYDLERGRWNGEWLTALKLDVALPELRWPHEIAGRLGDAAAARLGLPTGLPVLTGLGDAGAATLGAGVSQPGEHYVYVGTSGWVGAVIGHAPVQQGVFRLPLLSADRRLAVAPLTNAGSVHRWATDVFAGGHYDDMERLVRAASPARLLCLPYLAGERSPIDDPRARGVFFGVDPRTTPGDFARSALEGVAYALRATAERLGASGGTTVTLLGGGARSAAWCQIMADVLGTDLSVPNDAALLPVLGSAYTAFQHLGWATSFSEYRGKILDTGSASIFRADPGRRALYDAGFGRFQGLYPALQALY